MKIRTEVRAGQCPGKWYYGVVQESSGGGYYGSVLDEYGTKRFFNNGYTMFCPFREGVQVGDRVVFSPFEPPNERAGKIACIGPAPA
jgi:hypothetical protein